MGEVKVVLYKLYGKNHSPAFHCLRPLPALNVPDIGDEKMNKALVLLCGECRVRNIQEAGAARVKTEATL